MFTIVAIWLAMIRQNGLRMPWGGVRAEPCPPLQASFETIETGIGLPRNPAVTARI
jgi:hypothetical protein